VYLGRSYPDWYLHRQSYVVRRLLCGYSVYYPCSLPYDMRSQNCGAITLSNINNSSRSLYPAKRVEIAHSESTNAAKAYYAILFIYLFAQKTIITVTKINIIDRYIHNTSKFNQSVNQSINHLS